MKVPLLYGRGTVDVEISDSLATRVIRKPQMPLLENPAEAVRDCVEPVAEMARGCKTACVLVCDITRPVPNGLFLKPLIDQLIQGGIDLDNITILIATGLHRPNEDDELAQLIGDEWVLHNVNIVNHFALNDQDHVDMGTTQSGTPIKLDRRFVDADLKIATGLVEPHFMAGWSGGRKVVVPGIAHADTIRTLHSARFLEDPLVRECNLEGNSLHNEQLEILSLLQQVSDKPLCALNTVIDEERRLAFVNFGRIVHSHTAAAAFANKYCVVQVPSKYDVVVSSAAGFPLDLTYYQTVKGFVTPLDIVADDGTLIVASRCEEGLGSDQFKHSQRLLKQEGQHAFMARIQSKQQADVDEWETEMQLKAMRRVNIKLFSDGLHGEDRELTCVDMVDSLQEAVDETIGKRRNPQVALIPEGPYVVPIHAN